MQTKQTRSANIYVYKINYCLAANFSSVMSFALQLGVVREQFGCTYTYGVEKLPGVSLVPTFRAETVWPYLRLWSWKGSGCVYSDHISCRNGLTVFTHEILERFWVCL